MPCALGHKAGLIGIDGSPLRFHQAEGVSDLVNPWRIKDNCQSLYASEEGFRLPSICARCRLIATTIRPYMLTCREPGAIFVSSDLHAACRVD